MSAVGEIPPIEKKRASAASEYSSIGPGAVANVQGVIVVAPAGAMITWTTGQGLRLLFRLLGVAARAEAKRRKFSLVQSQACVDADDAVLAPIWQAISATGFTSQVVRH